ncbi:MAG: UDP-N-acetylmuramoyl-tripeptide--D-alanyl-D-alanine ligase [Ilumatobacteraceae bacterium]
MHVTAQEIATATGGTLIGVEGVAEAAAVSIDGVSFDSRELQRGQLFVALTADRDGHEFVNAAAAAGAAALLVHRPVDAGIPTILVEDTATAFMRLAAWGRDRLADATVVGVTGSVGKTSVKDLTAQVLRTTLRTAANVRSFNNEQGLPHTVLNAPDDTEALVLEMGMRGFGEIRRLCEVARPQLGVVTAVAAAHTERVGGIEGVIRAKGELVESLPATGTAVLNGDQPEVRGMAALTSARILTFGLTGEVRVTELQLDDRARARFVLRTPWGSVPVALPVSGAHMATNAAAAAAVGLSLGVPLEDVAAGIADASMSPWRMELGTARSGATVINDAYNANPFSMRAALGTLAALPARRRVAVVGVMAELADPVRDHLEIAAVAEGLGIELIAFGTDAYGVAPVIDPVAALGELGPDTAVLVKGSRVAALEKVAARLVDA